MRLTLIMPAHNERATIGTILCRVSEAMPEGEKEVVIVGSPSQKGVIDAIGQCLSKVGLSVRPVITKDEPPEDFDVKLEWYFAWTPQYPVACVHREFFATDENGIAHDGTPVT